jgi:hypothetical protein
MEIVGRQHDGCSSDVLLEPIQFVVPGMGTIRGF